MVSTVCLLNWAPPTVSIPGACWTESSRASCFVSSNPFLYNSMFSIRNSDYIALLSMIHLFHHNKIQIQHSLWTWSGPKRPFEPHHATLPAPPTPPRYCTEPPPASRRHKGLSLHSSCWRARSQPFSLGQFLLTFRFQLEDLLRIVLPDSLTLDQGFPSTACTQVLCLFPLSACMALGMPGSLPSETVSDWRVRTSSWLLWNPWCLHSAFGITAPQ